MGASRPPAPLARSYLKQTIEVSPIRAPAPASVPVVIIQIFG